MKPIIFLIPAENEMLDAASYYELKAKNLGRNFISEIERSKNIIAILPIYIHSKNIILDNA